MVSRELSGTALSKETPAAEAKPAQQEKAAAVPLFEGMLQQNTAAYGLVIADMVLEGEIAFRKGEIDQAVAALTEAVRQEDGPR